MVSYAERHVLLLNILKDLVFQDLDDDHFRFRVDAPYDTLFPSERTHEDHHRRPKLRWVDGVQVSDRYRVRIARLHSVIPQSDRRAGLRFEIISREGHIQQYTHFLIQFPIVPLF